MRFYYLVTVEQLISDLTTSAKTLSKKSLFLHFCSNSPTLPWKNAAPKFDADRVKVAFLESSGDFIKERF